MDFASLIVTGAITLIAAFGGGYLGHRFQTERDAKEYARRRQDSIDDAERAALMNMINACGQLDRTLISIAVRASRFRKHPQFEGVVIPTEDLLLYEEARSDFVTAYTTLRSGELARKAAEASQKSYDALISLSTHDLNDLGEPFSKAQHGIRSTAGWCRLLYYGLEERIDWDKSPVELIPMSNYPLDRLLREGKLRAHRPDGKDELTPDAT